MLGLPVFLDGPRCHQTSCCKTITCFVILSTCYSDVEYPRGGTRARLCMYSLQIYPGPSLTLNGNPKLTLNPKP